MNSYDFSGRVDSVDDPANNHVKPGNDYSGSFIYDNGKFTVTQSGDHITYSGPGQFWFDAGSLGKTGPFDVTVNIEVYPDKIVFRGEHGATELGLRLTLTSSFAVSPVWDLESVRLDEGPGQLGIAFDGSKVNG